MPKVSICIPAYNQAIYLKKTIDSVLSQTYTDYEIVITDDSQTCIVADLITSYSLPAIIKYYKNTLMLGSPENWNESVRKSSGEYIKILHHDDWLNYNDSLEKYVALLDENPDADFAFSATEAITPAGENWVHKISGEQLNDLKDNPLILFHNNLIGAPSTCIMRRNSVSLFDRNLKWLVDKEYYISKLTGNKNIAYSQKPLSVTFLGEGRVTQECLNNKKVEVYEYLYLLNKIYVQKNLYSKIALKNCLLHTILVCKNYKIKSVDEIRNCGYHAAIHHAIKTWLSVNSVSSLAGKLYLKLLRIL